MAMMSEEEIKKYLKERKQSLKDNGLYLFFLLKNSFLSFGFCH